MDIGLDITPLSVPHSGVGTYAANLFEHLSRREDDMVLPLLHRPLNEQAFACAAHRFPPTRRRRMSTNKTMWMQLLLPWQLARDRVQVSHFTNSVAPLVSPCPTVVTIHDMTLWLYPEHHYTRRLLAMRPVIPLVARRAAAIITVSRSAKADIVRILGVPAGKVHVVYEAASPAFRPLPRDGGLEALQVKYALPERFILYVGTIEPRKNLTRLLQAFAELRRHREIPHHLLFVGSRGWKDEQVFAAVEQYDLKESVRFLNYIPTGELVGLYNLADALAFPSLYEGFGLPVVEAMACGAPVVTSTTGSLGEVASGAAEFVDPLEVESIREGLRRVLTSEERRAELRARGLKRAARFTWEAAARETREVYAAVAGGA